MKSLKKYEGILKGFSNEKIEVDISNGLEENLFIDPKIIKSIKQNRTVENNKGEAMDSSLKRFIIKVYSLYWQMWLLYHRDRIVYIFCLDDSLCDARNNKDLPNSIFNVR